MATENIITIDSMINSDTIDGYEVVLFKWKNGKRIGCPTGVFFSKEDVAGLKDAHLLRLIKHLEDKLLDYGN